MAEKYMKIAMLGTGTFGKAWLVTSVCSKRNYVMKEVKVSEMSEQDLKKTQSEAIVLARCKHVNIVRYKESFLRDDPLTMCLVMEYADGGDLSEQVQYAKEINIMIPEGSILYWFVQVIFAVQYLHSNDILHRDLKTQNIFLTRSNMVKVGDFGIARFLRGKQDLATTATGTPYYLSPEICQRKPYNYKSDMWAVGCILYELCALSHPFEAEDFDTLSWMIMNRFYVPISPMYSELLHKLVAVFLRKDPEKRPSADQILVVPALKLFVQQYIEKHEQSIEGQGSSSSGKKSENDECVERNEPRKGRINSTGSTSSMDSTGRRPSCSSEGYATSSSSSKTGDSSKDRASSKSHDKCTRSKSPKSDLDHTYENIEILLKEKLSKSSMKDGGCPAPPLRRDKKPLQKVTKPAYFRSPPPAPPPSPSDEKPPLAGSQSKYKPPHSLDQTPIQFTVGPQSSAASPKASGSKPDSLSKFGSPSDQHGLLIGSPGTPRSSPRGARFGSAVNSNQTPPRPVRTRSVQTQTPPNWKTKKSPSKPQSQSQGTPKGSDSGRAKACLETDPDNKKFRVGFSKSLPVLKDTFTSFPESSDDYKEIFKIDL